MQKFYDYTTDAILRAVEDRGYDSRRVFIGGLNDFTRQIHVDDNGDGRTDRKALVPAPIFHFLNLLSSMGDDYWALPEQVRDAHVISGVASRSTSSVRLILYAHNAQDTQSRSDHTFRVALDVAGIPWPRVKVREYRFDRNHNTYYRLGQQLRDRPPAMADTVDAAVLLLADESRDTRLAALKQLAEMGPASHAALATLVKLVDEARDEEIKAAGQATIERIFTSTVCYSPDEVRQVQALSVLQVTAAHSQALDAAGELELSVNLMGNGASVLVIESASP